MEENKVVEQEVTEEAQPEVKETENRRKLPIGKDAELYRQYEYSDVYLWCGKCGSDVRAGGNLVNIQTALHIDPIGSDSHGMMAMACPVCGNIIALHFKEALNPPVKEVESEGDVDAEGPIAEPTLE